MYHVTSIDNLPSILRNGLIPGCGSGLMTNKDSRLYITNSLKYIRIMASDIANFDIYVILKVEIDMSKCDLVWWRGKGYKEWATKETILPQMIKVYRIERGN